MTPIDAAARVIDGALTADTGAQSEHPKIIVISKEDLNRGGKENRSKRTRRRERDGRVHADDLLKHANYNDEPDPAVIATVEQLVDTSKVIELEQIDIDALPKKPIYRFIKRAFDIVACSGALVVCAIPMGIIAIMVKRDSPGPVFYRQERLGWSIIGQKSGVVSANALRPALSALEARGMRHSRHGLGVAA